jgi:oxygen-independent coproporphyrinogen III oxidase
MTPHSLYVHIPFCLQRCAYCDFFSTSGQLASIPNYVESVAREARMVGEAGGQPELASVYFGGGTPSLLPPAGIAKVMQAIRDSYKLAPTAEITLEANPGTVQGPTLDAFHRTGINRLSIGVQSADDAELRMLGRVHTFSQAVSAVEIARQCGFANISLDLIFGLPSQSLDTWRQTLKRTLELQPEHLSVYCLTLEGGTPLANSIRRGALSKPEDDVCADMYALAEETLAAAGFRHYEISNWARDAATSDGSRGLLPHFASRHNLQYWWNLPYVGLGAGAHGCAAGRRYSNRRSVEEYIQRMQKAVRRRFPLSAATTVSRRRSREEEMRETVWLGLRLVEAGVSDIDYRERFGVGLRAAFPQEIAALESQGLLEWTDGETRLRLVPSARFIANIVFREFV